MNGGALVFLAAVVLASTLAKTKRTPVAKTSDEDCLRFVGAWLFDTTVKSGAEERETIIAWMRSEALDAAATCMEQNAANLEPCRELIIAAVQWDLQTRDSAELYDLEKKARAKGMIEVAKCLAQLRASAINRTL